MNSRERRIITTSPTRVSVVEASTEWQQQRASRERDQAHHSGTRNPEMANIENPVAHPDGGITIRRGVMGR